MTLHADEPNGNRSVDQGSAGPEKSHISDRGDESRNETLSDSPPAEGVRVSEGGGNDDLSGILEVLDDVLVGFLKGVKSTLSVSLVKVEAGSGGANLDVLADEIGNFVGVDTLLVDGARGHLLLADNALANSDAVIVVTEGGSLVDDTSTRGIGNVSVGDDLESSLDELLQKRGTFQCSDLREGASFAN